ncbi:MAG: FHA domain-containing protein, partial [Tannerellaceae bacterium]|nr:FHA domain-containing protein [Tannerellaceae bacterium]
MEQRRTEAYKRSFGDSVGAGLGALTGSGKRFYILEYLSSSKYHHAGESQKIILNQVELGRDPQCQIRFDDTLETVSRRHAAIVRDGDGWKLIHLSKVNDTLVNGQPVRDQWRLDNGDEIQLSSNGPRLRFILPQGEKSMIKNINFTERFSLFRQQVMRPYQRMMWLFLVIFILIIGGLVGWNYYSAKQSDERLQAMTERNEESEKRLMEENLKLEEVINDLTMQVKDGQVLGQGANRQLQEAMKRLQDDHSARLSAIEKNSKSREELIVKMTEENQEYIRHLEALRSEIANIKGQPNPAVVGPNYTGNAGAAATPAPGAGGNAGAVGTPAPGAGGNAGAVGTPAP